MATESDIFSELDQFDKKILAALAEDGRLSITDLATRVGLSKTPCQIRFKRLISEGYIEGFKAILNPSKMQLDHIAFVEVKLSDTREHALKSFNDAIKKIGEVEECHMIAGRSRLSAENPHPRYRPLPSGSGRAYLDAASRCQHIDECRHGDDQGRLGQVRFEFFVNVIRGRL
ncbi:Lrp/AsnC family transcriptional regulator (plasmid) [Rhizobium leguminosarum]|nr:Lrp/AsnC family transcriptional regulator [Rhizobium leguminosarum]